MRKLIITTICTIIATIAVAQSRLGSTQDQIRSEFWEKRHEMQSGYDKDGNAYTSIRTRNSTVFYYFNTAGDCTATFIIPDNQGALNFYVELYNSRYVIVSNRHWKMYSSSGIAEVKLIYLDNGHYYFMWSKNSGE
jgi:hypothetical protein